MPDRWDIIDDTPAEPERPSEREEDRLDLARVRAITLDRRAAHRRLLWARVIVVLFAALALVTLVDAFRVQGARRVLFAMASLAFCGLALRAWKRMSRFAAERRTARDETRPDPADLAALSDGSQFTRRLDELRR